MVGSLKCVFAGSPEFAAHILQAMITAGRKPFAVLTQPDRPAGRGKRLQSSPVKQLAQSVSIPVYQPAKLAGLKPAELLSEQPDILVVVAYGRILPRAWLAWPKHGALNVHASLLPRWRGAAPIERALMAGDEQTGICIMQMDAGLDTGKVLAQQACAIGAEDTALSLEQKLRQLATPLLLAMLDRCEKLAALPSGETQAETGVTYAHKITASDQHVDWSASALSIERQVRALAGRAGVLTFINGLEKLKIHSAKAYQDVQVDLKASASPGTIVQSGPDGIWVQCGCGGILSLLKMQLSRGKGGLLGYRDILNGFPDLFRPCERLGEQLAESKQ